MNPSGLWRGRCQGRIGHFKFINVELLPDRHVFRSSEQRQKSVTSQRMQNSQDGPPKTVEDLLKRISLEVIILLNKYCFFCVHFFLFSSFNLQKWVKSIIKSTYEVVLSKFDYGKTIFYKFIAFFSKSSSITI